MLDPEPPTLDIFEMPRIEHLDTDCPVLPSNAEEVRRLQVPVDDAQLVRLGDGLAGLEYEVDRLLHRQRTASPEPGVEVDAVEELHDHEGGPGLERAHVEHAGDVLVRDLCGRPRLTGETGESFLVSEHLRHEKLDGDLRLEPEVVRSDHDAHGAGAQHALDSILVRQDLTLANPARRLPHLLSRAKSFALPPGPDGSIVARGT